MTNADQQRRMRRALRAIEGLQARLEAAESGPRSVAEEPIAIIGLSCRFPGGESPEAFWNLLDSGRDAISRTPGDRWDADRHHHPRPATPGKIVTTDGGFLDSVYDFDPHFFGMSPREAVSLDPQQRLLLEVSWEAMELGGIVPAEWAGKDVGVFIGISASDYSRRLMSRPRTEIDAYLATGNSHSVAAGRLSYTYGFTGPSLGIDTACSSSLVALHDACRSLMRGECSAALAGGVNCLLTPDLSIAFSQARMLSPDGRCKTFSNDANGFVRAEGCGVVVLKRLSDAKAAGNDIQAVIRGAAVNQDGRSSGLTVPNGPSQQAVLRAAMRHAGVDPAEVFYAEAHGTGTELGDPIELNALSAVFGDSHSPGRPLHLGSVKTNVGHMEAAAGIGGLTKMVLAMRSQRVPAHLHCANPTTHVDWAKSPLRVTRSAQAWGEADPPCAVVSSFGFSGTNACIVLQRHVEGTPPQTRDEAASASALMLSAKTDGALNELASEYASRLESGASWRDLCWTALKHRSHFQHRLAVVAEGPDQAAAKLRSRDWLAADMPNSEASAAVKNAARFVRGESVEWTGEPGARVAAPTYPFQRQEYRCDTTPLPSHDDESAAKHPMLGPRFALARCETAHFPASKRLRDSPLWAGHRVFDRPVLPAVGHLEMMAAALRECGVVGRNQPISLHEVSFAKPLYLDVASPVQVIVGSEGGAKRIEIAEQDPSGAWSSYSLARLGGGAVQAAALVDSQQPDFEEGFVEARHVYQRLADQQVAYDDDWRLLRGVNRQGEWTRATIRQTASKNTDFSYDPQVLDACLQSLAARFLDEQRDEVFLPEGIGRIDFHGDRLRGEEFTCLAQAKAGHDWVTANVWLSNERGETQVVMTDLRLRPVRIASDRLRGPSQSERSQATLDESLYQIAWLHQEQPIEPVGPGQIIEAIQPEFLRALKTPDARRYTSLLPKLDELAAYLANDILQQTPADRVAPEQRRQYERLAGVAQAPPDEEAIGRIESELSPLFDRELALLRRCAASTADVLVGERNPLEVLFPQGASDDVAWLYEKSIGAELLNSQVREALARLINSSVRPLRVLEIGAGTGGTTSSLVPLLNRLESYTATDISPLLIDKSKQRFRDAPGIGFRTLDIEKEPGEQGLASGAYDVIVAANVMHATTNLGKALGHIDDLLAPRGHLVLLEGTRPLVWLDMVFGLTRGWWQFEDELRDRHALLSARRWESVLGDAGYSATALGPDSLPQTVIVAQRDGVLRRSDGSAGLVMHDAGESSLEDLLQTSQRLISSPSRQSRLVVVTQGAVSPNCQNPDQATAWGFARTLQLEHPEMRCQRIDLDPLVPIEEQRAQLDRELTHGDAGTVMFRDGKRHVARLKRFESPTPLARPTGEGHALKMSRKDNRLEFEPIERRPPRRGEVEISVQAAGVNLIDVLDASGLLPFDRDWMGVECAGVVVAVGERVKGYATGDAVVALAPGTMRDHLTLPVELVCPWDKLAVRCGIPVGFNAAEATTIPAGFLTAELALRDVAKLSAGERVLIHSAAGGTGMAAVRVAKRLGAEVFATASRGKWGVLRRLGVSQIADSRSLDFADRVMEWTNGEGVHVVLNALTGEYVTKGLGALASGGRFIELGKRDIWSPSRVAELRPDAEYHVVDLMSHTQALVEQCSESRVPIFAELQHAAPLPRSVFAAEEAPAAFDYMRHAKHIGKVILSFEEQHPAVRKNAGYLVTGGLGGLGVATAEWLVNEGAQYVFLLGRSAPTTEGGLKDLPAQLRALAEQGKARIHLDKHNSESNEQDGLPQIHVLRADAANREQLGVALGHARSCAPLRGVVHAAGVLLDATIRELCWDHMQTVLRPKVDGAKLLDELTRDDPLDFFVLYSSAASLLGSPGQASHVAANSYLDSLAQHRWGLGLPALSINWGPWSEIGSAADEVTQQSLAARGIPGIPPALGVKALQRLLGRPDQAQVGVLRVDTTRLQQLGVTADPLFWSLVQTATETEAKTATNRVAPARHNGVVLTAMPLARREKYLVQRIQTELAAVLGYAGTELPQADVGFFDLGLDSLMAVDLKNRLASLLPFEISPTALFQHPNAESLARHLAEAFEEPTDSATPLSADPSGSPTSLESGDSNLQEQIANELAALDKLISE